MIGETMMTKSIDDESPEAWNRINKWHRNGPDQHPLFPTKDEKMPEAKMTRQLHTPRVQV